VNVIEQLDGQPQLTVWADSEAWIRVVNKEISAVRAFLTGRLKWKGDIALLLRFQKMMA
jgi:putative sterol carrier protein